MFTRFSMALSLTTLIIFLVTSASVAAPLIPLTEHSVAVCTAAITVTTTADSGAASLRQAIADLCANGTITFAPALAGQTIVLSSQ